MASECQPPKATIPHDIIVDILSRQLRVRDLCRFRCVSKSWLALLSDSVFLRKNRRIREKNPLLLVTTIDDAGSRHPKITHSILDKASRTLDPVTQITMEEEELRSAPSTAITSMGLVCTYGRRNVCICNPVTKKWVNLSGNYAVDVAFGYIASTSSYKVLRVVKPANYDGHVYYEYLKFEVRTVGSSRWRAIDGPPGDHLRREFFPAGNAATIDGSVYILWDDGGRFCNGVITAFDLKEESWSFVPFLSDHYDYDDDVETLYCSLVEMGGRLCWVNWCRTRSVGRHCIEIWLLKGLHENMPTWEKECSIDMPMEAYLLPYHVAIAIEQETGKILLRTGSYHNGAWYKLICYDPHDQTMEEIYRGQSLFSASYYIESFEYLDMKGFNNVSL